VTWAQTHRPFEHCPEQQTCAFSPPSQDSPVVAQQASPASMAGPPKPNGPPLVVSFSAQIPPAQQSAVVEQIPPVAPEQVPQTPPTQWLLAQAQGPAQGSPGPLKQALIPPPLASPTHSPVQHSPAWQPSVSTSRQAQVPLTQLPSQQSQGPPQLPPIGLQQVPYWPYPKLVSWQGIPLQQSASEAQ
jgi:hypothetical protein